MDQYVVLVVRVLGFMIPTDAFARAARHRHESKSLKVAVTLIFITSLFRHLKLASHPFTVPLILQITPSRVQSALSSSYFVPIKSPLYSQNTITQSHLLPFFGTSRALYSRPRWLPLFLMASTKLWTAQLLRIQS